MKKITTRLSAVAGALALTFNLNAVAATVVNFESVLLPNSGYQNGSGIGDNFKIGGATFVNSYESTYGSWSGFAFSKHTDTTTPGYANQYSAISGSGAGGSAQYAVGYNMSRIMLSSLTNLSGMGASINNTTYAGLSMLTGDPYAKKFGGVSQNDPDFFLLNIKGYAGGLPTAGSVNFYLADFRFANNTNDYIVNQWTAVDFSALGTVDEIRFSLTSSDNGTYGMNTPAYFALDNLSIPEPSSMLMAIAGLGLLLRRKR